MFRKFFVLLSLFFLSGYSSSNDKKIRIITENYPPYSYEENGEIIGSNTEIVKEILKRLQQNINIEIMEWDKAYNITLNENNTALFSTYKIPERENLFKWVGPLSENQWSFFAKKDSGIKIENLDDAKKYMVGAYKSDACATFLENNSFEKLSIVINDEENAGKLLDGSIDLWIGVESTARDRAEKAGVDFSNFEKVYDIKIVSFYLAFNKNTDDNIITVFQKTLDQIRKNN